MAELHIDILDKKRKELLPFFERFKDRFYLAGGTALALQLGHRDSIDFDFFTDLNFNSGDLLLEVKDVFEKYPVEVIQAGNKTLNVIISGDVKASFFCIKEKLLKPAINSEYLNIATIDDIACMKIVALLRAEFKDYVDLFYLFKIIPLDVIIANCRKKYEDFDEMIYLKALVSFDDINVSSLLFEKGKVIDLDSIEKDFKNRVNQYLRFRRI